jgi:hypothetical protein
VTTDGHLIEGLYGMRSENAPVAAAAKAAQAWLDMLDPAIREQVSFPLSSDFWRHWHNTPLLLRTPQIELLSLPMLQREFAMEVVKASLSPEGYWRTREVMANNLFLGRLNDLTDLLDDWAFTLSIFGKPSTDAPWGWQLFGHHLALNCVFAGDQMVLSPVFMGVEPDIELGPQQRRLFQPHEERALRFMNALTDAERSQAVVYSSMLTKDQPPGSFHPDDGRQRGGAFQDNRIVPYEGVPVGALDATQRKHLLDVAEVFISNMPMGSSDARMH